MQHVTQSAARAPTITSSTAFPQDGYCNELFRSQIPRSRAAPPLFVRAVRADIHVVPSVPRLFSVSAERNSYPFNSVLNVPSVPNWLNPM